jgi:maltoporin
MNSARSHCLGLGLGLFAVALGLAWGLPHRAKASEAAAPAAPANPAPTTPAATTEKPTLLPIEFGAYWRLGYQTDLNPLQANRATQGNHLPTTRHARNPNYFDLQLGKAFENGARVKFAVDNEGYTPHQDGFKSPNSTEPEEGINDLAFRDPRVRDLYLQVPVGDGSLWAGARRIEWEDIRIFDFGNPFNVNGYGVGGSWDGTSVALSVEDREAIDTKGTDPTDDDVETPLKDVSAVLRHEIALGEGRALKPMFWIKQFGTAPENKDLNQNTIKGATAFRVGGIYSSWSNAHGANIGLWFESNPVSTSGSPSGTNTAVGFMASNSYEFASFGILTGVYLKYDSVKESSQEFKVSSNKKTLEADGTKTTNNQISSSIGVQPVYYATDKVHLALDLNYAASAKKLGWNAESRQGDANALIVTPVLRYAMNRNVMGTPQIYTSVSYGHYDWKVKSDAKGNPTDTLVTTQTGFEVWF